MDTSVFAGAGAELSPSEHAIPSQLSNQLSPPALGAPRKSPHSPCNSSASSGLTLFSPISAPQPGTVPGTQSMLSTRLVNECMRGWGSSYRMLPIGNPPGPTACKSKSFIWCPNPSLLFSPAIIRCKPCWRRADHLGCIKQNGIMCKIFGVGGATSQLISSVGGPGFGTRLQEELGWGESRRAGRAVTSALLLSEKCGGRKRGGGGPTGGPETPLFHQELPRMGGLLGSTVDGVHLATGFS